MVIAALRIMAAIDPNEVRRELRSPEAAIEVIGLIAKAKELVASFEEYNAKTQSFEINPNEIKG